MSRPILGKINCLTKWQMFFVQVDCCFLPFISCICLELSFTVMTFMLLQELLQSLGFWGFQVLGFFYLENWKSFWGDSIENATFRRGEIVIFFLVGVIVHLEKDKSQSRKLRVWIFFTDHQLHPISAFLIRGCDKPCGGGQQTREKVCLGSDGLKYPSLLGRQLLGWWMLDGWWWVFTSTFVFFCPVSLGGLEDCIRMQFLQHFTEAS